MELFKYINTLSVYKLYIRQILIKFIQRQTINDKGIIEKRMGKCIKIPFTSLTFSKSSHDHMCKTIFNNLDNDVKSQIKYVYKLYSNNTSNFTNNYNIKKYYNYNYNLSGPLLEIIVIV